MSRGRPRKDQGQRALMMESLSEIESKAQQRIKSDGRVPIAPKSKLDWHDQDPDYQYYWASTSEDYPVKIQQFLDAGYTMVRHDSGNIKGEPVIMNSRGCDLYLLRIPKEYYLEDEKIKRDKSLNQVKQINEKVSEREYAGNDGKVAKHEYVESPDAIDLMGD